MTPSTGGLNPGRIGVSQTLLLLRLPFFPMKADEKVKGSNDMAHHGGIDDDYDEPYLEVCSKTSGGTC